MAAETLLALWNDTPTRRAIVDFVQAVSTEGSPGFVAPAERVAVFDNDGTLWSERNLFPSSSTSPFPHRLTWGCSWARSDLPSKRCGCWSCTSDADREFVVSMKEDWSAVFASA